MGVVYHGNYIQYFEVGRVEYMRDIGVVYAELEKEGIGMPVVNIDINYRTPAVYDEELTQTSHKTRKAHHMVSLSCFIH